MLTSLGAEDGGLGGTARNPGSTPQWTTRTLPQSRDSTHRQSWLRPNEQMATAKAACRTFSPSASAIGPSNSSGPCTVKL